MGGLGGAIAGGAVAAVIGGALYGAYSYFQHKEQSQLNEVNKIQGKTKECIVQQLIADINSINDLPTLLCKAREINANDAAFLRAERGAFRFSLIQNIAGKGLGHEQSNTRSWQAVTGAIEKRCKAFASAAEYSGMLQHLREILNLKPQQPIAETMALTNKK